MIWSVACTTSSVDSSPGKGNPDLAHLGLEGIVEVAAIISMFGIEVPVGSFQMRGWMITLCEEHHWVGWGKGWIWEQQIPKFIQYTQIYTTHKKKSKNWTIVGESGIGRGLNLPPPI